MAKATPISPPESCNVSGEEDELERMAVEELLNEAKRAKERSQTMGTYGWQKRKATTNKRFLHNTLVSTLREYNTDSRHHQKRYGLNSSTVKSDQSKSITDDSDSKLAGDTILDEANHNSESIPASVAEVNNPPAPAGSVSRPEPLDRSFKAEGEQVGISVSTGPLRKGSHLRSERKEKHRKRSRSRSLSVKKTTYSGDGHWEGCHGHGRESKSSKHKRKRKHKDGHSRSAEGHKSSRK